MGELAVDLTDVVKTFGTVRALDQLTLQVHHGEVHGFLGPNGSGKSTAIRVLLGLLRHDGGTARLFGGDPWADAAELHRRIAYVPGDVNLWPGLSGGEVIDMLGRMRGGGDKAKRDTLIERFHLDPRRKTRTYSKGNRQKVALIAAFSTDAELFLFDEPTSGLDPLMEAEFRDCVAEVTARGATVLLSSHILGEVERLCNRVTIINEGRTVRSGTLDELRVLTHTTVTATLASPSADLGDLVAAHTVKVDGNRIEFSVDSEALDTTLRRLADLGVTSISATPPTLEELFLDLYRRPHRQ
ncbi:MAG: ABC transporter ATP-binding protein [Microthrixaceae bacterium]